MPFCLPTNPTFDLVVYLTHLGDMSFMLVYLVFVIYVFHCFYWYLLDQSCGYFLLLCYFSTHLNMFALVARLACHSFSQVAAGLYICIGLWIWNSQTSCFHPHFSLRSSETSFIFLFFFHYYHSGEFCCLHFNLHT